ncbi:MAG: hypothetical protein IT209_01775 [Armatimonadetes bacterium]|nr:hypothetical protein [Armatimonadota bacterium]
MKNLLAISLVLLAPFSARAAVDGTNIRSDFCSGGLNGCAALMQVQNNHTGFGDTRPGTGNFVPGSELDQLFVYKTQSALGINITGNIETNGNAWVIFLDVTSGGENVLDTNAGPGALTGQAGTKFDEGFEPDYAIVMNTGGGSNVYVDLVNLQTNTSRYLGFVSLGTGGVLGGASSDNPNGSSLGFDNSNSAGVQGDPPGPTQTPEQVQADAATALKGAELLVSFADLGIDQYISQAKIMVVLTGGGGYYSNQFLPGIGGSGQLGNLGNPPKDLSSPSVAPGNQYATVDLSQIKNANGAQDGNNIPLDSPTGSLVATQNNYTGFGNGSGTGTPPTNGSELDALYLSNTSANLNIGIAGNLEGNGNYYIVFLETGPDGVPDSGISTPPDAGPPSGIMNALNGTSFDVGFSPTHAILVNIGDDNGQKMAYVNLYDFRSNVSRYLGKSVVDSGDGTLTDGDNPHGALAAFNNTNALGVTDDNNKTPAENEADAQTADTGLEMSIPFTDIGLGSSVIKYMVVITGNHGYFSNQTLPGLGGYFANLGDPPVNFGGSKAPGLQYGSYTVTGISYNPVASISALKQLPDGTGVQITSTVTAVFDDQSQFYIQDGLPGNISGILVSGSTQGLQTGQKVTVTGLLARAHNERALIASTITPGGASSIPNALVMTNKTVAGASLGDTPGATNGQGVNNVALLVRSTGQVTASLYGDDGIPYIYLNDGGNLFDGNFLNFTGLRVEMTQTMTSPNIGEYVTVTGVSSLKMIEGKVAPIIRPRGSSDITVEP